MEGATAAEVISFATKLEENAARFYEELAKKYPYKAEFFLAFARENRSNKLLLMRTYQETITDALEAGFSFQGLTLNDHKIVTILPEGSDLINNLKKAIEVEDSSVRFHEDIAERSGPYLATISEVLKKIAKKRDDRKSKLQLMLKQKTL